VKVLHVLLRCAARLLLADAVAALLISQGHFV
jgi:hypothetical protein